MAEKLIGWRRCSCRATPSSCRCELPTAEGRKGAAARGEGRNISCGDWSVECSNMSTFRPTRCRALSAAERRSARRQRFVVRAGRRTHAATTTSATLPLRYSALKTSTCLYLFYMVKPPCLNPLDHNRPYRLGVPPPHPPSNEAAGRLAV